MTKWAAVALCFLGLVVFTACGAGASTGARHVELTTWSGYALSGGHYTEVSASWVQPSVDCSVAPTVASKYWEAASFWDGLDGLYSDDPTVEQTGTEVICDYGRPSYDAWYELWPGRGHQYSNIVQPGDKISASVTTDGLGHFTLILADPSEGWTRRTAATFQEGKLASAEVIAEVPRPSKRSGYRRTLADFGTVGFTGATANGTSFTDANGLQRIDMVPLPGNLGARTSPMANAAFSVTWTHFR